MIGSLFAAASSNGMWLYRVVGETPQRWRVAVEQRPDTSYRLWGGPHSGYDKPYFDKSDRRLVAVRDAEHFAAVADAHAIWDRARSDAKAAHRDLCDRIDATYKEALAALAQGIEARQGGDAASGSVHESPVGTADAP